MQEPNYSEQMEPHEGMVGTSSDGKSFLYLAISHQDLQRGCLETLTGGFWAPVVTRKHLLEGAGMW